MSETIQLATYVSNLTYDAIPAAVSRKAKECLLDSLAVGLYGSLTPWGRIVANLVKDLGGKGTSSVLGESFKVPPTSAAFANGTMIHGFELDNSRQPSAGSHPGATIIPALLAVGEELHTVGKDFLTALVAGCEVLFRIGLALGQDTEKKGVHLPGMTGTFGAAVATGMLRGLNVQQLACALGIAGSFSSGLLEFSRSQTGGMVKRLHLGRAAEGGVLASLLAERGFTGPQTILEGEFGFCRVYSEKPQIDKLTYALGQEFETLRIGIKRYPCHTYAHAPIEAVTRLMEDHRLDVGQIEKIVIAGEERLLTHHALQEPKEIMTAQYSVPYCVALALCKNPEDPENFSEANLYDAKILEIARKVELRVDEELNQNKESRAAARVSVKLKDGRELRQEVIHFKGTPENPVTEEELMQKVERLAGYVLSERKMAELIDKVRHLEDIQDMATLLV